MALLKALVFSPAAMLPAQTSQPASLPELKWHLTARPWTPLNTPRTDPLDKVENIVNQLVTLQYWNIADPGDVQDGGDVQNGSIIDPFNLREHQYATPYFAFAVATVVSEGRSTSLLEAGARALDHATADIAGLDGSAQANDSHGEFFGAPMMKALRLFKTIAAQYPSILTAARIARWENRLSTSRVNYMNNGVGQNWRTYGMKGEWLRVQDGLVPRNAGTGSSSYQGVSYIEYYWNNEQRPRYSRDRDVFFLNPFFLMYHDDDTNSRQNFAYHGGATGNLLDMIRNGYDGPSRQDISDTIRFAARSSLLTMSGNGDAPASGRTGNHVWNDVVYGNTFDQVAEMAWADGDARLAGQFRRAARLAFKSAWRFQQEQGWFSVTKSLLPPAHKNVYFDWSALTNYNGYTEIHSSEDFATRLTDIPEQPVPAEIGGFAFNLDTQFAVAFANAGGMELQMVTRGSSSSPSELAGGINCFTLGIVRFCRPDWDSRLGPADGWMASDWSSAISFSPTFLESGTWQMTSQLSNRYAGTFTPTFVHPLLVRGTLAIAPKSGQTGPSFAMDMTITPDGALVDTKRTAGTESFGVTWPLLEFDGKHLMSKSVGAFIASAAYPKQSGTRTITEAEAAALSGGVTLATTEPNYSGTAYAVFPSSGGAIEWTGVNGGNSGAATVGFRYTLRQSTAASRDITLRVNGTAQTITFVHTGTSATYGGTVLSFPMYWHQLHVPVTLAAGAANTIRLEGAGDGGLNIDEMRVYPADAAQPEPDQENFISLDAAPSIDGTTPVRRSAYGDQRPLRVTNSNVAVATFVYPRKATDPAAEAVRTSFVRSGTNFSSMLGRVNGNLYVGRTSAGGAGTGIDLASSGTNDVVFSGSCSFVLQLSGSTVTAVEADRFVTATIGARQVKLAPYTPIAWSGTATLWNNIAVPASGRRFEAVVTFTPQSNTTEILAGFAGEGVTDASALVAALRFGSDGMVTPVVGTGLVELPCTLGVAHRIRVLFDLNARTYSIWVKPTGSSERRLVANAALPASVKTAGDLDTFAWFGESNAASTATVTEYASPVDVKINFQATTSAGYPGYLPDTGSAYGNQGNGYTYGWIEGANTALTRDRNSASSPDERYDTLNQMQFNNPPTETHTWEIALPNGTYNVRLVCGDPGYTDSYYNVLAEGVTLTQGNAQSSGQHFFDNTAQVTVSDGRLTLTNGAGSFRNKVCFIEIASTASAPYPYRGYQDWASGIFASGTSDPAAAPSADPNHNGLANAVEYGAGLNPQDGASNPAVTSLALNSPGTAEFRFFRSASALDADYRVWQTTDLVNWNLLWSSDADADFSSPLVSIPNPSADNWVTLRVPTGSGVSKQFFRLEVAVP
jgi:hypothetical protein